MVVGDVLDVGLEAPEGDDLTEDKDVEDQESDEEKEGALRVMEGHTVHGDPSDEVVVIEEVYPEPSDVSIGAIDLKEGIEVTEGNEDALEDIIDVVIDLFVTYSK